MVSNSIKMKETWVPMEAVQGTRKFSVPCRCVRVLMQQLKLPGLLHTNQAGFERVMFETMVALPSLKLTVRSCQEAIRKGNESSSNHPFLGVFPRC